MYACMQVCTSVRPCIHRSLCDRMRLSLAATCDVGEFSRLNLTTQKAVRCDRSGMGVARCRFSPSRARPLPALLLLAPPLQTLSKNVRHAFKSLGKVVFWEDFVDFWPRVGDAGLIYFCFLCRLRGSERAGAGKLKTQNSFCYGNGNGVLWVTLAAIGFGATSILEERVKEAQRKQRRRA